MTTTLVATQYIGIAGAPYTGKTTLLQLLQDVAYTEVGIKLEPIRGGASRVHQRTGYKLDSGALLETQFSIDADQLLCEEAVKYQHKITNRTLLDAYAHSKANRLTLDLYYEALLPRIKQYTTLIYLPIEEGIPTQGVTPEMLGYRLAVDNQIRWLIRKYNLHVQVVKGTLEQRLSLAWEAVRLKF